MTPFGAAGAPERVHGENSRKKIRKVPVGRLLPRRVTAFQRQRAVRRGVEVTDVGRDIEERALE